VPASCNREIEGRHPAKTHFRDVRSSGRVTSAVGGPQDAPRRPTYSAQRQQGGYLSPADVDVANSQSTLPPPSQRVEAAPQTRPSSQDRARAYAFGNKAIGRLRSLSSLLTLSEWHVCVRCHRNKRELRSGSELVSLPDRILLMVACRLCARVIHACDVGIARRGAQIGRLGEPCKAGWALVLAPHC
jgi:hypothetical protein